MKILFPTDFSENSEVALRYAKDLLRTQNGKITLLNVYEVGHMEDVGVGDISNFGTGPSGRLQEKVEEDAFNNSQKKLIELAEKVGLYTDEFQSFALKGHIKTAIDETLRSDNFDVVVLGTRGENSQKGVFFGGIANHLITSCSSPVMAIPANTKYKEVKKIVYPTDLEHDESDCLNWIINYAKSHGAKLHLIHIDKNVISDKSEQLRELVEELPYDNITYEVVHGDKVSDVIAGIGNDPDVDVISMTTHTTTLFDKLFHSSLTAEVMGKVNAPIIAFSEKDVLPFSFE
jgi:nucleotide-binding universal stress UspA family protein